MDRPRLFTLIGDPHDVTLRGGSAYFFLQAAQQVGFALEGVPLCPASLQRLRWVWNGLKLVTTGRPGGFQYSPLFLHRLLAQARLDPQQPLEFISRFPLLPAPSPQWQVSYHIDATLRQNFDDYGIRQRVGPTVCQAAIAQEQANYRAARYVICMSRWAARSVVQDYGIDPQTVQIIGAGANLDEAQLQRLDLSLDPVDTVQPLRLGFVGKDWQRKGLPYVLAVADALARRQVSVEVAVIGVAADHLPPHPALRSLGFISKAQGMEAFVAAVRSFHFGCLFSTTEALGISNLECLRLGVPVLARRVGGIPETVPEGLGHLFNPEDPPEAVAAVLASYVTQPETYWRLRQRVRDRAGTFTWQAIAQQFLALWDGSQAFQYHG
jgi:glycosyltransferase involved in cell wall biosynthesis